MSIKITLPYWLFRFLFRGKFDALELRTKWTGKAGHRIEHGPLSIKRSVTTKGV